MKNILLSAIILLSNLSISALAQEQVFVFSNDVRPEYNKNITVDELNTLQKTEDITIIDVRLT
ncbi:hypothetical protein N9D02_07725 [Emcibacteraceae bacterium]|nr:hypothetical protein [Emcibacteraceae bacterium]